MIRKLGPTAKARKAKAAKRAREYRRAAKAVVGEDLCCRRCGKWTQWLVIHHKRPRSLVPERRTDPTNFEPLCEECHSAAHASGRRT